MWNSLEIGIRYYVAPVANGSRGHLKLHLPELPRILLQLPFGSARSTCCYAIHSVTGTLHGYIRSLLLEFTPFLGEW